MIGVPYGSRKEESGFDHQKLILPSSKSVAEWSNRGLYSLDFLNRVFYRCPTRRKLTDMHVQIYEIYFGLFDDRVVVIVDTGIVIVDTET